MGETWTVKVRERGRVTKTRFGTIADALDALQAQLDDAAPRAKRDPIDLRVRTFDPVAQVAIRGEISGPSRFFPPVLGGVDIRGDGSAEAYRGRTTRELVALQRGETPCDALRRVLL